MGTTTTTQIVSSTSNATTTSTFPDRTTTTTTETTTAPAAPTAGLRSLAPAAAAVQVGLGPVSPGTVTTYAGTGTSGNTDGPLATAKFFSIESVMYEASGSLLVTDGTGGPFRRISIGGVVSSPYPGLSAGSSTAVDSAGNIYVAQRAPSNKISKIDSSGIIYTVAGSTAGYLDGIGTAAQFNDPVGIAVDSIGNIFVTEWQNRRIRKITPAGVVTTFAGSGAQANVDGLGLAASFTSPWGLTIDSANNLYVTESAPYGGTGTDGNRIRKISSAGQVTTLAGSGVKGAADGTGISASFTAPTGITVDLGGNLYVVEGYILGYNGNRIRRISPSGVVTTIAGSPFGSPGYVDGAGSATRFNGPRSIAIDYNGNLFVSDTGNVRVRKITGPGQNSVLPVQSAYAAFTQSAAGIQFADLQRSLSDPVNTATGAFSHATTDVTVPARGVPFVLERSYDSRAAQSGLTGPFGPGWGWNLTESITSGTGNAIWKSGSGQQLVFTLSGTTYTSPPGTIAQLVAVAGGGWKLVRADQVTSTFDATGRLLSKKDRSGQGLTSAYGTGSQLSMVTDAAGQIVTFTYGATGVAAGLLTQVKTADLRTVSFGYTAAVAGATRLTSVTDPLGKISTLTYTTTAPAGLLASEVDPLAHAEFVNVYDTSGRVTDQADATGAHSTFAWNDATGEMTMTDATGAKTTHRYTGLAFTGDTTPSGTTSTSRNSQLFPTNFTDALGKTWTATYDIRGNMLTRTSPLAYVETWTYDAFNNPLTYKDARGNTNTMTYDTSGRKLTEARPLGVNLSWSWNPDGTLASSKDPRGGVTSYTYDTVGRVLSQTTPMGFKTTYTYDTAGRVLTITDPRGNAAGATAANYQQKFTYDSNGRVLTSTDALNHTTTNVYDDAGNLTKATAPDGGITSYTYNSANEMLSETAPNGGVTSYQYTARGEHFRTTLPDGDFQTDLQDTSGRLQYHYEFGQRGRFWEYVYNARNEVASMIDPAGRTTTYTYDDQGRRLTETRPDGITTATAYDATSNVLSTTVTGIGVTSSTYDTLNRVATMTDPRAKVTTYGYDLASNKTSMIDPLLRKTTYAYDPDGRMTAMVDPRGYAAGALTTDFDTLYTYDEVGNQRTLTDPLNLVTSTTYDQVNNPLAQVNKRAQTTSYLYDSMNRVSKVTAPLVGATSYTYDTMGSLKTRTNPLGKMTSWDYDILNRKIKETDPLGRFFSYTYDKSFNDIVTITDANANAAANPVLGTTTLTYDKLQRLTGKTYSDGTPAVTFTYDAQGRRATMVDGIGTTTYGYDTANRVTTVTRGTDVFSYTYDNNSNVTSRTYPGQAAITATFDDANQMKTVVDPGGTVSFGYDLAGNPITNTYPNGTAHTVTYDRASRIAQVANTGPAAAVLSKFDYTRDNNGNPTLINYTTAAGLSATETQRLTYDNADRLTQVCYTTATCAALNSTTWTYDNNGNRATQIDVTKSIVYTYDAADELTKTDTTDAGQTFAITGNFTYNANGDMLTSGDQSSSGNYRYNTARQLTGINGTNFFAYDGNGNRAQWVYSNNELHSYLWDTIGGLPNVAVETATVSGSVTKKQLYTYGRSTETIRYQDTVGTATTSAWYLTDHLGSVMNMTGATGAAVATFTYDPFGIDRQRTITTGYTNNHLNYTGQYNNGNSYNLRARRYVTTLGRFTQTDPMPKGPGNSFEGSYVYAVNSPTSYIDPSGLRGVVPGSENPTRSGGVGAEIAKLFKGAYRTAVSNWNTWGQCGSIAFNWHHISFAKSGCFVDDGDKIYGIDSKEHGFGASVGLSAGAGALLAKAGKATRLSGYSACLDASIDIGAGGGVEVCLGLNYSVLTALGSAEQLLKAFNGVVSIFLYASVSAGGTEAVREVESKVFPVWDYPWIVEQGCGHVMRAPTKFMTGVPIPLCNDFP